MARGHASAATVTRREELTRQLFAQLQDAVSDDERETITTQLVEINLPLGDALAARYLGRGVDFDDLQQVARTALWVAIGRFRPAEGRSFVSFAVPTITGELKRYFRDHCWVVRPPRQIQDLRVVTARAREDLEQSTGRAVTTQEIGDHLGIDQKQVAECLIARAGYRPLSLDAPTSNESSTLGASLSTDGDIAAELTDRLALRRALSQLSPRDQQVLVWRFDEECTQSEIAVRLGLSQMQVSRIIRRILDTTRDLLEPAAPLAG
jgi:RNA polymerase sigma-B factor